MASQDIHSCRLGQDNVVLRIRYCGSQDKIEL